MVHGAWHNNQCWNKVSSLLRAKGHIVFTPDLPGHGVDLTPFQAISLETYVNSLLNLIAKQTESIILLGHSMAGVVVSQIAEYIPEKIRRLVYVAGFVPANQGSLLQESSQFSNLGIGSEMVIDEDKNEISLKLSSRIKELFYNACDEQVVGQALIHLQKQPFRPFLDKVTLSSEKFGEVSKLYIECLRDEAIKLVDQRRMYQKLNCQVAVLDTDHSPFLSTPLELSEILMDIN